MTRHGPPEAIATCACGAWYGDDHEGRESHKAVFGHYPVPPTEKAPGKAPQSMPEMPERDAREG